MEGSAKINGQRFCAERKIGLEFAPPASRRRTRGAEAAHARRLAITQPDVPPMRFSVVLENYVMVHLLPPTTMKSYKSAIVVEFE